MRKTIKLPSTDGINSLHVVIWKPEKQYKAIVQISHGMVEYIERYDEFANFLNDNGILVIGNDHLGHGKTAIDDVDFGYFGEGRSETVVNDLHEVTLYAKKTYGEDVPYFLFGHSMGSFMARRYLMTYGSELKGAIISGTGHKTVPVLAVGKFIAGTSKLIKGDRHRSKLLKKLSFLGYNKRIKNAGTENDWLSRNEENVKKYNGDRYCTFCFTVNGYQTLFDVLGYVRKKENYSKIPKNLPIFFIAGVEDPVGAYGKGVKKVFKNYKKSGIEDIEIKLYDDDRHEIINEVDREVVYEDALMWIEKHI